MTLHKQRIHATLAKTLSLLLRADRSSDLRTALSCVREARSNVELLAVTMRQLTTPAVEEPTQDAQAVEDGVSRPARRPRGV